MNDYRIGDRVMRGLVAILLSVMVGGGCMWGTRVIEVPVQADVERRFNDDSPLAVDLVVVYDDKVHEKLLGYSAKDWFEEREQVLRDFPSKLDVYSWEWPPLRGEKYKLGSVIQRHDAKGMFVFADYFSAGDHRVRVEPGVPIKLMMYRDKFLVTPLRGVRARCRRR